MKEVFERYALETGPHGTRITFDQRRHAVVNVAFGLVLAVLGYLWDASLGTVVMGIGVVWVLLALRAYSDRRATELGEVLTYRNRQKERTLPKPEVVEVAIQVRREARRRRKQPVLPWEVAIWGGGKRPFASYRFQAEEPARAFAARLSRALATTLVDRSEITSAPSAAW